MKNDLPSEYNDIMNDQKKTLNQVFVAKVKYDQSIRRKDWEFYQLLTYQIILSLLTCSLMVLEGIAAINGYLGKTVIFAGLAAFSGYKLLKVIKLTIKTIEQNEPLGNN